MLILLQRVKRRSASEPLEVSEFGLNPAAIHSCSETDERHEGVKVLELEIGDDRPIKCLGTVPEIVKLTQDARWGACDPES
jgi:hypothetical protein